MKIRNVASQLRDENRGLSPFWEVGFHPQLILVFPTALSWVIGYLSGFTNLKVTIYAGVSFINVRNGNRETTTIKSMNLSLQSTKQLPFFASLEVVSVFATQAQLE